LRVISAPATAAASGSASESSGNFFGTNLTIN